MHVELLLAPPEPLHWSQQKAACGSARVEHEHKSLQDNTLVFGCRLLVPCVLIRVLQKVLVWHRHRSRKIAKENCGFCKVLLCPAFCYRCELMQAVCVV